MQSFTNKDKIMFFFLILGRDFFFLVEVKAFTVVLLKILAFSISESYFITLLYSTLNIKYSIFLSLHLK